MDIEEGTDSGIFLFSGSTSSVVSLVPLTTTKEKVKYPIDSILVEFDKNKKHNLPVPPPLDKKAYKSFTDSFRLGDNTPNKRKLDSEDGPVVSEDSRPAKRQTVTAPEANEKFPVTVPDEEVVAQGVTEKSGESKKERRERRKSEKREKRQKKKERREERRKSRSKDKEHKKEKKDREHREGKEEKKEHRVKTLQHNPELQAHLLALGLKGDVTHL
jgi:hypothetical protein